MSGLIGRFFIFRTSCAQRTTPPALRATSPYTGEAGRFYSVPPPLTQGRLGDFAPCHLPLHRGGWEILLRATSPYTGEAGRFCSVSPPLAQGRLGDFAPCHLPLHRGGWEILLRVTSTYIRDDSRFCEIIPLEDTPHGSLVQRELSAQLTEGLSSYHCVDVRANSFKIFVHLMIGNPNHL